MKRRQFITAAAVVSLAGCTTRALPNAGGGLGGGGEITVETTTEPTPEVLAVNLVSEWEAFGDAVDEARDYAYRENGVATIAWRFAADAHDGTVHVLQQVEVYHKETGAQVVSQRGEEERLTDGDGREEYEAAYVADTSDWDTGMYVAEVTIRDEVTGEVSEPGSVEFQLKI